MWWYQLHCRYCGQVHEIALDASGHYVGPLPCEKKRVTVQVDPQEWRRIVTTEQDKKVH